MFYHSNKAKGSSAPSNFTVSWSSFFSTSAVRKRDHLAVTHRTSTSPADDEVSGVITPRTFRNKSMFQGSPNNWTERGSQEETLQMKRSSGQLFRATFGPFTHQEIETTAQSWRSSTWLWTAQRRFQKVTRYFGFLNFGGPGPTLYRNTICRRRLLIICDNQAPVKCC